MSPQETVIERLQRGQHTALLGPVELELPSQPPLYVVPVNCARSQQPLAPLYDARAKITELAAATHEPMFLPDDRHALHRRLFDEGDEARSDSDFVAAANRLQRQLDRQLLIVFEHVDRADKATIALLSRIVDEGSLLATLLITADTPDPGRAGRLISTLKQVEGDEAVVIVGGGSAATPEPSVLPELKSLHFDVLRVLRAGSTAGDTFEADVVGELLGLDNLSALEILQAAIDEKVPIDDLGEGVFRLQPDLAEQLRSSVTPSLASAWHQMLGMMLGGEPGDIDDFGEEMAALPETKPPPKRTVPTAPGRAAAHAEAAGDVDRATRRYVAAAQEAASVGGHEHAVELLERALALLERAPQTPERRELRMTALMDVGRLKWVAAGQTEGFDLDSALVALEGARELAEPSDAPELRAEIGALMARVSYEIGGNDRLERALGLLGDARRTWLHAGRRIEAARLLNDEAAVRVRLGQLAQAAQLLQDSRDVFAQLASSNAGARRELADTEHLTARLLLHAPAEHQNDPEALALAVESARAAERRYDELGDVRSCARAWETMARLELMRGRGEESLQHLTSAVRVQERMGDAVGLARTLAAMSDVMAAVGAPGKALALLTDSVAMNQRKGSRQGLRYNREALEALTGKLSPADQRELEEPLNTLRARLEDAR
jgi:tetratricopeptide (TPR) repeat protein